mmetsp:Transcript_26422/g.50014  ORF Transcript_26422/g.50014 Transcript_26422/m.50014 type:complete len:339 (-) Transcript_26422:3154-4170(-)
MPAVAPPPVKGPAPDAVSAAVTPVAVPRVGAVGPANLHAAGRQEGALVVPLSASHQKGGSSDASEPPSGDAREGQVGRVDHRRARNLGQGARAALPAHDAGVFEIFSVVTFGSVGHVEPPLVVLDPLEGRRYCPRAVSSARAPFLGVAHAQEVVDGGLLVDAFVGAVALVLLVLLFVVVDFVAAGAVPLALLPLPGLLLEQGVHLSAPFEAEVDRSLDAASRSSKGKGAPLWREAHLEHLGHGDALLVVLVVHIRVAALVVFVLVLLPGVPVKGWGSVEGVPFFIFLSASFPIGVGVSIVVGVVVSIVISIVVSVGVRFLLRRRGRRRSNIGGRSSNC